MRMGLGLLAQNSRDWTRFLATERHDDGAAERPEVSDAEIWDEELSLGLEAESLGFDSLWVPEHHFTPYAMVPNPLQALTYFAARTEHIDLGTMVTVTPWYQPLRLAEEAALLQNFMGTERNLFLGLGRGAARREFESFGIPMGESQDRFYEIVDILRLALSQDRFSYDGTYYQIPETSLRPQPRDGQLLGNLHFAWGSPTSAPLGAAAGLSPLIIPQRPWESYADEVANFYAVREERGYGPIQPKMIVWAYCGSDAEQAREATQRYVSEYVPTAICHYELGGAHFATTKGYEHYALADIGGAMPQMWMENSVWGTPDQCYEKIEALHRRWNPSHLSIITKYGTMPLEEAQRSTRLFASEVLPAAKELVAVEAGVH